MLYTVKDVPGKRIIHMESWVEPKNNAYCCARAKFPNPHKFYAEKLSWIKARKRRQYFPIKKPPDRGKGLVRKLDGVAIPVFVIVPPRQSSARYPLIPVWQALWQVKFIDGYGKTPSTTSVTGPQ